MNKEVKLCILNKELTKYGLPEELILNEDFNGHQKGIAVCLCEIEDNKIIENYIDNDNITEIFDNSEIVKLYQIVLDGNTGKFSKCVYVPYYVKNHSCFVPGINQFPTNSPDPLYIDIELVFSINNLTRYSLVRIKTQDMSIWRSIEEIFNPENFVLNTYILQSIGVNKIDDFFGLDFYDIVGERNDIKFDSLNSIKESIISFRILGYSQEEETKLETEI